MRNSILLLLLQFIILLLLLQFIILHLLQLGIKATSMIKSNITITLHHHLMLTMNPLAASLVSKDVWLPFAAAGCLRRSVAVANKNLNHHTGKSCSPFILNIIKRST